MNERIKTQMQPLNKLKTGVLTLRGSAKIIVGIGTKLRYIHPDCQFRPRKG